jgi:DNA polymerase bacteriophage-type
MIPPPPNNDDLRYGTALRAGMSQSLVIADFDFETYSPAGFTWNAKLNKYVGPRTAKDKGLKVVGATVYTQHPEAEVICLAYNLKDGFGSRSWTPGQTVPLDLFIHLQEGKLIEAWNVSFEYLVWNNICVPKYGFPPLDAHSCRCAAAKSRAHSLPGSLAPCGEVVGIKDKKDKRGKRLIQLYTMPRNPTKKNMPGRVDIKLYPQDYRDMIQYNLTDIKAEAELSGLIPDLSPSELEFWQIDQRINHRGIRVDKPMIEACIRIIEQAYARYEKELPGLTNNAVTASTQLQRIKNWMIRNGVAVESLKEKVIEELLKTQLPYPIRRVLEIRQLLNSAAVKKVYAMHSRISRDGRVKELFIYHGAHTGRAAGASVQPQNMPNGGPDVNWCNSCHFFYRSDRGCSWCGIIPYINAPIEWKTEAVASALTAIRTGSFSIVEYYFKNPITAISGCLRSLFIAAEGHDLLASDYVSIEGVVLACIAGESWMLEVYNSHGMIYEMTASKITGTPLQEFIEYPANHNGEHHPERKLGKVGSLASGYGGWIPAWIKFGADKFLAEHEIKKSILRWRDESPNIVKLWAGLEEAAHNAVIHTGQEFTYNGITYIKHNSVLYCRILSGRCLTYHKPELCPSKRRPGTLSLSYEGWNSTKGWQRIDTYGGRLTENVVQAVARDILAYSIKNLEYCGYKVVLHVHDEIVCEMPEGLGSVGELESIMMKLPQWAKDWPIKAARGWRAKRYQK